MEQTLAVWRCFMHSQLMFIGHTGRVRKSDVAVNVQLPGCADLEGKCEQNCSFSESSTHDETSQECESACRHVVTLL